MSPYFIRIFEVRHLHSLHSPEECQSLFAAWCILFIYFFKKSIWKVWSDLTCVKHFYLFPLIRLFHAYLPTVLQLPLDLVWWYAQEKTCKEGRTSLILSALFFLMHSSSSSFFPLPCCYSRPLYLGHCTHPWGWETDGNFPPLLPSVFPSSSSPLCLFLCLQRRHYRFISAEHHSLVYKACPVKCRWTFWGRRRTSDLPMRCWCPNS